MPRIKMIMKLIKRKLKGSLSVAKADGMRVGQGVTARQICTLREYAERAKAMVPTDFDLKAYDENKKRIFNPLL